MSEEQQTTQAPVEATVQAPQPVQNVTSIQAARPVAEPATAAAVTGTPAASPVPAPQPVKLDKLKHTEDFTFKDANGFEWHYKFQFPGVRKAYEMLDNAKMANGMVANAVLYDEYLQNVVVDPLNLTLDDFNDRPGLEAVMDAADSFLGKLLN